MLLNLYLRPASYISMVYLPPCFSRCKALARGERHRVSSQVFGDRHHRTHLCGPFDIAMKIPRFQKRNVQIVQVECNRSVAGIVLPSWDLAALE